MSVAKRVLKSTDDIQSKFFERLEKLTLDTVTEQKIKESFVYAKIELVNELLKEFLEAEKHNTSIH